MIFLEARDLRIGSVFKISESEAKWDESRLDFEEREVAEEVSWLAWQFPSIPNISRSWSLKMQNPDIKDKRCIDIHVHTAV